MEEEEEEEDVVIVGGGICGLATALALHRKGGTTVGSRTRRRVVVFERRSSSSSSSSTGESAARGRRSGRGGGIAIYTNGWRALDQLIGLPSSTLLRSTALPIHSLQEISLDDASSVQNIPLGNEELRCVKRSDVIEALANSLPSEMLRLGCQVVAVKLDNRTCCPVLELQDGSIIKAKVVIGCDGANSVVADSIGLKPNKLYSTCSVIGFTNHPNGHKYENVSIRMRRGGISVGRIPMDDKLVYWFIGREWMADENGTSGCEFPSKTCLDESCIKANHILHILLDSNVCKDVELIKKSAVESVEGFPAEIVEMVEKSELNSLILTRLRYRAPWEILFGSFRKGAITVAGDAMHVMGPFLGQGGSAALEDAVVLARCLAPQLCSNSSLEGGCDGNGMMQRRVEAALDKFVHLRRMRLVSLSAHTHVIGLLSEPSLPFLVRFVCVAFIIILFRHPLAHTLYDCGCL